MPPPKSFYTSAHIIGWILFFSLMLGFAVSMEERPTAFADTLNPAFFAYCFIYVGLFYLNSYLLLPKLYLQRRYLIYFSIIAVLFMAICWARPFDVLVMHHGPRPEHMPTPPGRADFEHHHGRHRPAFDMVSIVLFMMTWSFSTAVQILTRWRTTEQRAIQAETEKTNAELSFLKAQINPHFLFNTLNNIYSLSVMKSDAAPAAIMQLSHIMRYVTDEIVHDYVPLEQEIECLSNYIDLQRLRLNEKSVVNFSVKGPVKNSKIAPLILMTFIENVFKYGISSHDASSIQIQLSIEDGKLDFFCQNRIFSNLRQADRPGVGIENTKKRLAYLYPDKHSLNISTENDLFTVHLQLELQ